MGVIRVIRVNRVIRAIRFIRVVVLHTTGELHKGRVDCSTVNLKRLIRPVLIMNQKIEQKGNLEIVTQNSMLWYHTHINLLLVHSMKGISYTRYPNCPYYTYYYYHYYPKYHLPGLYTFMIACEGTLT